MYHFQINKKLLPMKMHYFLAMAGLAPIIPFMSTMSRQRGYSTVIVSLIFTILPLPALLVRPAIGVITDKYKCFKSAIILNIVVISISTSMLMFIPGSVVKTEIDDENVIKSPLFWLFFSTIILLNASVSARTNLEDTICINLLDEDKTKYGLQRMWGAIGWGIMSIVSGVCVDWFSKGLEYKNHTPGFIISLICYLLDLYVVSRITMNVQNSESQIGPDIKKVLTNIKVVSFFLWVVAYGMLLSIVWYFLFLYLEDLSNIYHPEMKPYIKTLQGLSLTIQCFGGEVPFFFLSKFIIKRMGHMNVFSLMFLTFAFRFYLYSIITNPVWVLPVELLNGITLALAYSATISYAGDLAPDNAKGTLQGVAGMAVMGIGAPIGSLSGGYLFNRFGSITSFKLLSGVALAICIIQTIVNQLINRILKNDSVKREESN
ncbi:major facilitator superfamily domain-containing protein 6-A-like [Rhopalosiphum maidis]|uniref:major facilitator superfamily domain-containing protein 6-A-like n=1 Tax=Rhopalosiphum maidis TaxID=43146 RepID=UPI000EFDF46F|nr:major facilitator superfamily domain-containing protein 6-A-like [Rhopalosiphum maidis]